MKYIIALVLSLIVITGCKQTQVDNLTQSEALTADKIVLKAMNTHGSDDLENSTMTFSFRTSDFMVNRKDGDFLYGRLTTRDRDTITDHYTNKKTTRYINGIPQQLPDSVLTNITSGVNSVVYFAQLPYSLDGDAVNKRIAATDTIKGIPYYEIEVTFDENGGGEDHEDVFIYWIHQQDFTIDYLAYSYCEEECGYRFRESVNRRNINGVIVQDYNNYRAKVQDPDLTELDDLFQNDGLELLSEIKTENVNISLR